MSAGIGLRLVFSNAIRNLLVVKCVEKAASKSPKLYVKCLMIYIRTPLRRDGLLYVAVVAPFLLNLVGERMRFLF